MRIALSSAYSVNWTHPFSALLRSNSHIPQWKPLDSSLDKPLVAQVQTLGILCESRAQLSPTALLLSAKWEINYPPKG